MIMKRITAYLKDKVANIKAENKEKRVYAAIETAKLNKEAEIADAEVGIEKAIDELAGTDNIGDVIQRISNYMDDKEEAQRGIKRLEEIKKFLSEDIDTYAKEE